MMNINRLWTIGGIIVVVAIVLGTWFVGIAPKLQEAATAEKSRAEVQAQNESHEVVLAALKKQFEGIDELDAELLDLRLEVPGLPLQPEFMHELHTLADQHGVVISTIDVSEPSAYVALPSAEEGPEVSAARASVNEKNFFEVTYKLTVAGEYSAVVSFLDALQHSKRLFLVYELLTPEKAPVVPGSPLKFEITGQVFVLLDDATAAALAAKSEKPPAKAAASEDAADPAKETPAP